MSPLLRLSAIIYYTILHHSPRENRKLWRPVTPLRAQGRRLRRRSNGCALTIAVHFGRRIHGTGIADIRARSSRPSTGTATGERAYFPSFLVCTSSHPLARISLPCSHPYYAGGRYCFRRDAPKASRPLVRSSAHRLPSHACLACSKAPRPTLLRRTPNDVGE